MGLADKLGISGHHLAIDWDLTPSDTFAIFESWGGRERIRNNSERHYYFYIDNWTPPAKLYLMERGVKHARILAKIDCPQEMIERAVAKQGKSMFDQSYAIDGRIKEWLLEKVIEAEDYSRVQPIREAVETESLETNLPKRGQTVSPLQKVVLRDKGAVVLEKEVPALIRVHDFYDAQYNPAGSFANVLVDGGDTLTVVDERIGVMWQRGGCDLTTIRNVQKYVEQLNASRFAGHDDWRLPTMEEALSLVEPEANEKGIHLHPCFSKEQPFIFLADQRKPGGYWFIDYKQATVFWASGTIPGGFGRVCRTV
ncbi:Lcl C-terminal domain-containing protein [Thiovibrio sp. JS02]